MRQEKLKTWILLGYTTLLLSLGPSLHQAHFFGLHTHSHPHAFGDSVVGQCCCQHDEFDHQESQWESQLDSDSFNLVIESDHECPFCKFFDQYNGDVVSFQPAKKASPALLCYQRHAFGPHPELVAAIARGPPATI